MEPACDRELAERQRSCSVCVIEDELDLARARRRRARSPREEDVIGLLGAQPARGEAASCPDDRVGDVGLPRPVGAYDDGHARLELELDRLRERLEAAQAKRAKVHLPVSLTPTSAAIRQQ